MFLFKGKEFVKIEPDKFIEDMNLTCDIYYRYKDELFLVINRPIITVETINKIKKLDATYDGIYIESKYLNHVLKEFYQRKTDENYAILDSYYENISLKSQEIMESVEYTSTIPMKITEELSEEICEMVINISAASIIQLINNVRKADEYLFMHGTNVGIINGLIGKWINLDKEDIARLVKLGLLHDVGKFKVPPQILYKPAKLTEQEFEVIKLHPIFSYEIAKRSNEKDTDVLNGIRSHHEKINGTGYPDRLKNDEIPLFGRITTISDIYDAMISKRVYKDAHSPFEVLDEFSQGRFSNLDLNIVNVFLDNMPIELIGKPVLLSDGSIGKILYINSANFMYPIVETNGEIVLTNEKLKCVAMYNV